MIGFDLDVLPYDEISKLLAGPCGWASFSIWAYRRSVSDIDREANATGFQVESAGSLLLIRMLMRLLRFLLALKDRIGRVW